MKQLILAVLVMMVASSTAMARDAWTDYAFGGGPGGNYYGSSGGYHGNGYYGDSDAGKMMAAGQLILDISHAVGSYETTHRTLGMGERAQRAENQNRSRAQQQSQQSGGNCPSSAVQTNPQTIYVIVKKETQVEQKKTEEFSSENQKLQKKIEGLEKKKKEIAERKELQKKLVALQKEIADLEKPADSNSTDPSS